MKPIINRSVIALIKVIWEESPNFSGTKVLNCPSELRVIKDFFYNSYPDRSAEKLDEYY